jgi:protein phosphatase 4 regulatory subunit 3
VWTEPDGADYALSFQDPEGCAEVWNFILEVQRMMNDPSVSPSLHRLPLPHFYMSDDQLVGTSSPVMGPEPSITTTSIIRSGRLPLPQMGIVDEIDRAIKALARTPSLKERVVEHVQKEVRSTLCSHRRNCECSRIYSNTSRV